MESSWQWLRHRCTDKNVMLVRWSGPSAPQRTLSWGSLQKPHTEVHMAKHRASCQQPIPPCQTRVWNTLKADRAAKPSMTAAQSDGLSWLHSAKFWALNQTHHMRNNSHCHFEEARFGVICYSTTNTLSSVTVTMKFECTWASVLHCTGHTIATGHGSYHPSLSFCTVERFLFLLTLVEDWEGCAHQSHALGDAPMADRAQTMQAWEHHLNREKAKQNPDSPFRQPNSRSYRARGNTKSEPWTNRHAK